MRGRIARCVGALAALLLAGQRPDFQVDANLVTVRCSVRDGNGAFLTGLRLADFHLTEDGASQTLRFVHRESDAPLALVVILDLSRSQLGRINRNVEEGVQFVRRVMEPGDRTSVVAFGRPRGTRVIQGLHSEPAVIEDALRHARKRYGGSPRLGLKRWVGCSPVHDALYYSARDLLPAGSARRTLVIISDGEDNCSQQSVSDVIEMLQGKDTVLYALNGGRVRHVNRDKHPNFMDRIALETGGKEFLTTQVPLAGAFRQIEDELRSTYVLGYVPERPIGDGKFRKIQVAVDRPGCQVTARTGYYARRVD